VTLHDTRGALALAGADDVDQLAGLEEAVDSLMRLDLPADVNIEIKL